MDESSGLLFEKNLRESQSFKQVNNARMSVAAKKAISGQSNIIRETFIKLKSKKQGMVVSN